MILSKEECKKYFYEKVPKGTFSVDFVKKYKNGNNGIGMMI